MIIALFVGFGLFSFAFWAYFRFRPDRTPAPREVTPAAPYPTGTRRST